VSLRAGDATGVRWGEKVDAEMFAAAHKTKDESAVNQSEYLSERVLPKELRIIAGEVSHV
jgi:hypothetical protein